MKTRSATKEAGFSLLETLAALILLGVSTAALASSFAQSDAAQIQLVGRRTALVLGESKLAELSRESETVTSGKFAVPYDNYRWFSENETSDCGLTLVAVTVEWSGRDGKTHQKVIRGVYQIQ
jgi:type II secretory pathway pseudopilin PulG